MRRPEGWHDSLGLWGPEVGLWAAVLLTTQLGQGCEVGWPNQQGGEGGELGRATAWARVRRRRPGRLGGGAGSQGKGRSKRLVGWLG